MSRIFRISLAVFLTLLFRPACAQTFSISTDLLGYARLGTMNLDASYALSRRWSLIAGVRYNPFTFRKGDPDRQFQMRQQSYSVGVRMWPWHTWSGWWLAGKVRYQEYNEGGIISRKTEEGDRFGAGLYAGYTYMLSSRFNLELGFGLWAGMAFYRQYSCPVCGLTMTSGSKFFLRPDDFMISAAYVF